MKYKFLASCFYINLIANNFKKHIHYLDTIYGKFYTRTMAFLIKYDNKNCEEVNWQEIKEHLDFLQNRLLINLQILLNNVDGDEYINVEEGIKFLENHWTNDFILILYAQYKKNILTEKELIVQLLQEIENRIIIIQSKLVKDSTYFYLSKILLSTIAYMKQQSYTFNEIITIVRRTLLLFQSLDEMAIYLEYNINLIINLLQQNREQHMAMALDK